MEVRTFTQGDTLVPLTAILKDGTGAVVNLTEQSVYFIMENVFTEVNKVDKKSVQITDAEHGEVQYNWEDGDVSEAGTFWGYFVRYITTGSSSAPVIKTATHPVGKQLQIVFVESPVDVEEEPEEPAP